MADPARLDRLERWMQAVVMHPGGAASGVGTAGALSLMPEATRDLEAVVTRSRHLTALDRLGIYAEMYYLRLVEVLTAEYPTTRRILGAAAFERACRAFLARHPSTERTLQGLSAGFPKFLKRHLKGRRNARLAIDVARIERAMEEVFDAPRAEPLRFEALQGIAPDQWGAMHLELTPALRLLALDCDADAYMTALRSGRARPSVRARPTFVVVFRKDFRAWRLPVSREQFRLLEALGKGWPIGRAVYASCRNLRIRPERLATLLSGWFREFAAEGLLVGLEEPGQS